MMLLQGVDRCYTVSIYCIVPIKTHLSLRDFDKSLVGTSGYGNFIDL